MSTPPNQKNLWKNVKWKDKAEKSAFFNHYFKHSSMVTDRIDKIISAFKQKLIDFIKTNEVKEGDKKRPVTIKDILEMIEND